MRSEGLCTHMVVAMVAATTAALAQEVEVDGDVITGGETIFARSPKIHNSPGSNRNRD
jgi:hypothetical protein